MSLLRVSALRPKEDPGKEEAAPPPWLPSHVQVTVVQARGLRAKGGPGDAFVALQLGRQKHRTSVATQRGGCPRWAEECTLELPPTPPPDAGLDAEALLLQLTVWQRALVGMDRFLGRAAVPLAALLRGGRAHQDQWYKLHSKPGRKEKDRGEVQLSIQFTRHSLTASMFDLSIKDKPRSPFRKLKDKVKGRQKYDLESASAIVPSSSGALDEDFDLGGKKSKAKGFFFKNKLRKSSLTQSNTSLGSDSTISSAGSAVAIGMPEMMAHSPSRHSSLSTDHPARDVLLSHKRAFSDEVSQINMLLESKSIQSLKPQNEPISRSSLCINGSHIYCEEPSPKPSSSSPDLPPQSIASKPEEGFSAVLPAPEPDLPPWSSSIFQKGPSKDPPRFIPSPPILAAQEEDKLSVKTIALNKHRGRVKMEEALRAESKSVQVAAPVAFSTEVRRVRPHQEGQEEEGKRSPKTGLFRRGSSKDEGRKSTEVGSVEPSPRVVVVAAAGAGERGSSSSSWFSLQESTEAPQKPSCQPGPHAATEAATDTCFPEDHGPSPFIRVGNLQAVPAAQCVSSLLEVRPPPTATAPLEWDDHFDAFASSRLWPEAPMELSVPPGERVPEGTAACVDSLGRASPPEETHLAEFLFPWEGEAHGSSRAAVGGAGQPGPGSPELLSSIPDETLVGRGGLRGQAASESSSTTLPWGQPCEEDSAPGSAAAECVLRWEPPGTVLETEAATSAGQRAEREWSSERLPSDPASTEAWEGSISHHPALGDISLGEKTVSPESKLRASSRTAETGGAPLADGPQWDLGGAEAALRPAPPAWLPEEATRANMALGCGGPEKEEGGGVALEPQEQGGEGKCRAEGPPPKPPRRFTPLSLEEEASWAAGGGRQEERWQGGAAERDELGGPVVQASWQSPPMGEDRLSPVAVTSLAPTALIGAGGGGVHCATEGLGLDAKGGEPAGVNELRSQDAPSGDSLLAVNEGAGGAEQFETCPSKLSLGGLGLSGAKEVNGSRAASGEASSPVWPCGVPEPGLLQTAKEIPRHRAGGGSPSRAPQEPQPSPSVFFWTAVEEEQQLPPSQDSAGLGEEEPSGLWPSVGQGDERALSLPGAALAGGRTSQARPAVPPSLEVLAGGMLRRGREGSSTGESDLSSSWSDDRVMDFKKADFWQAGRGEQASEPEAVVTAGNPFAPRPPPSPQNNPFVERPPDALPAEAMVLPVSLVEGRGFSGRRTEAGPPGLLLAHPSEDQPAALFLHGNRPLAFSTPSFEAAVDSKEFSLPSPILHPATVGGPAVSSLAVAQPSLVLPQLSTGALAPSVLPTETQRPEEVPLRWTASPHPVKPISSTLGLKVPREEAEEEQEWPRPAASLTRVRSGGREELKMGPAAISLASGALAHQLKKPEPKRDSSTLDPSAKYYHLTHDEVIQLLLKREAELSKKQERVQELENYIDCLLVRIMEQSPTLLQLPLGGEAKAAK
ncbi:rab11 family-interacting protein 5 [Rhineura floridana]|uniref:rab11 family-interacting protein 5 n=1 Tax=Rhineura floridana TaxID=261503 RepID=UPI002AC86BAE|nr:rab11 family-interacting protein 5 [Rhineura floridana]